MLEIFGFRAGVHTTDALQALNSLADQDGSMRIQGLSALGQLHAAARVAWRVENVASIVGKLEDVDKHVRRAALTVLGQLPAEAQAACAAAQLESSRIQMKM